MASGAWLAQGGRPGQRGNEPLGADSAPCNFVRWWNLEAWKWQESNGHHMGRFDLMNGNWTMAGVRVPYWTRISEAGFDVPAVLLLADLTLSKLQSLWLVAWHGMPVLFPIVKKELFSKEKRERCYVLDMSLSMKCMMSCRTVCPFERVFSKSQRCAR